MKSQKVQLVWFKKDLRTSDHAPLIEASNRGRLLCFYIYETFLLNGPEWDPAHGGFLNESLAELERDLRKWGLKLYRFEGEVIDVFNQIQSAVEVDQLWSHQETGKFDTYQRDLKVKSWCRENAVKWNEFSQFGVVRGLKSRDGWARNWNAFIVEPPQEKPRTLQGFSGDLPFERSPYPFEDNQCSGRQKGGAISARATLESFLQTRGRFYSKQMSSPQSAWEACSRLSPYLSFGNISLREIWNATELQRLEGIQESGWKASLAAFTSRLRWHCHFIQKLEDEPVIEFQNMNREMDGLRESEFNHEYFEAWKNGQTGYPLVDACMRALHQTGWINFRMRAMLVSFSSYHLWLHWKEPALFLAKKFLDFEPGIHYSQFQMQSGTTGINAIRIYSPIKQVIDQDPDGVFIKKWVPELASIPIEYIAEPHKMPKSVQNQYGCVIGKDYPSPIVDHVEAYQAAKKRIFSWRAKKEVREASRQVYLKHGSRKRRKP